MFRSAKGESVNLLITFILEVFWKLWKWTIRYEVQGLEAVDREIADGLVPVFAVPHHTILLSALCYGDRPATLLASLSADGEIAARFLQRRGYRLVRGSSSRGGKEALSALRDALQSGQPVAITFDGPRGPRLVPKAGVAVCAWHATGSLFLLKFQLRPVFFGGNFACIRLNSWDRFLIPLPFCKFSVTFAKLGLPVKKDHPPEEWVNQSLEIIRTEAFQHYAGIEPAQ
jgi:hypothetical protein